MKNTITKEQELTIVYEHLFSMIEEVELDPTLSCYAGAIYQDLQDFEKEHPEIVAKYLASKQK